MADGGHLENQKKSRHLQKIVWPIMKKFCTVTHTVSQKNDSDVAHYNFDPHQPILVIFGRGIAKRICY